MITIANANALHIPLPDRSVQCIVTSPPYWALRSYLDNDDDLKHMEIGLENTPAEYVAHIVAVMRECWRVLKDDGTLWINLGDSYAGSGKGAWNRDDIQKEVYVPGVTGMKIRNETPGLKLKDLCGIPWLVAKALQVPYYIGRIKDETERAWLAGFIDGEGTISFVERDRGENRTSTHDARIYVTNTDRGPLDYFSDLTAGHVYLHDDGTRENRYGSRPCYRWQMGTHDGALLLRELYPYLRTKRKQAALIWTLYTTLRHQNGHARTPEEIVLKRHDIAEMVRTLNAGGDVVLPEWVEEPPSATEPGWYLRSDIIWHKPNPMPESVTDRPTKSHEYVFLLTKQARYYYDAEAIREDGPTYTRKAGGYDSHDQEMPDGEYRRAKGFQQNDVTTSGRNRRSVWTIATSPYSGAHFATFPPALIEPMILAGTSARGECPHCGKAWVRVVEKTMPPLRSVNGRGPHSEHGLLGGNRFDEPIESNTIGWLPDCSCYGYTIPPLPDMTDDVKPPDLCDECGGTGTVVFDDLFGRQKQPCQYCDGTGGEQATPEWIAYQTELETVQAERRALLAKIDQHAVTVPQLVLDPFAGSGTTGQVAVKHGRRAVLLDLNMKYIDLQFERTNGVQVTMQL